MIFCKEYKYLKSIAKSTIDNNKKKYTKYNKLIIYFRIKNSIYNLFLPDNSSEFNSMF